MTLSAPEPSNREADLELLERLPLNRGEWVGIFERLRQSPGVWARVRFKIQRKYIGSIVQQINKRQFRHMPPGIYKACQRSGQLYVCYCGDAESRA